MKRPISCWWSWVEEYADEGSIIVEGKTEQAAKRNAARWWSEPASRISVRPVTADDVETLRSTIANLESAAPKSTDSGEGGTG